MRKILTIAFIIVLLFIIPVFSGEGEEETTNPFEEIDALYFTRDEGNNLETYFQKLNEMLTSHPNDGEVYWRISRYYYWKGKLADEKDDKIDLFNKSQEWAEKGIAKDPQNPEVHYWQGVAMGMIGDTRGVLKSFFLIEPIKTAMNNTLQRNPNHDGAHHVLGVMYRKLPGFKGGDNEKSAKELLKAIELKSNDTLHHYELAVTYVELDKIEEAKAELKKVLNEEDPSDPIQAKIDKRESRLLYNKLSTQ